MTARVQPVILSGGSGERLWPLSRTARPKQFLSLVGPHSLLQQTALRVADAGFAPPLVVCSEEHRFFVAEQLRAIGITPRAILLEPVARNTAAAIGVAAAWMVQQGLGLPLLVLPSDHFIPDATAYRAAVLAAADATEQHIVTFGITPSRPETGYGYIAVGPALPQAGLRQIARFIEKPDAARAASLLQQGGHYWNAGMFMASPALLQRELRIHAPAVADGCTAAIAELRADVDFIRLPAACYAAMPAISFDYAVMEKTAHAAVAPLAVAWSDVGSFQALHEVNLQDGTGNVCLGDVLQHDSHDNYLFSEGRLLAVCGINDLAVVATADAVLVAPLHRTQEVRQIMAMLKEQGRPERTGQAPAGPPAACQAQS